MIKALILFIVYLCKFTVIFADKHVERKFICYNGEIGGSHM